MKRKPVNKGKTGLYAFSGLIIAAALYAFSQYPDEGSARVVSANPSAQTVARQKSSAATLGAYANGAYTGSSADAYYGTVQVKAVIQNGQLADVQFLQYPSDRSTSRFINGQAMPMLTQEAVAAQSANVSGVSGATDTSMAFVQSLASALAQAKG